MRLFACCVLTLALGACALPTARPPEMATPGPQDRPQPVPGDIGLAGTARPDIARFLNVRSVSAYSPSPDATQLAYHTSTTGQPQLWIAERAGGAPRQLTYGEAGVTFHAWSPDGAWILYGADRGGDEREGYYLISPDGWQERELLAASEAFRVFGGWSPDGRRLAFASTERNGVDFDIYLLDIDREGRAGAPRRVHQGRGGLYPVSWRPDGGALVLSQARGEADNDLHLLDLASGELRPLFQPEDAAAHTGLAWTPEGQGFYLSSNQGRDLAGLAHYRLEDGRLQWLETPPHDVETVALSSDAAYLAWAENDLGYSRLRLRRLADGQALDLQPALPEGVYDATWAARAATLFVRISGPGVAGDVWAVDAASGRTHRVTTSADGGLDPRRMIAPEAVAFPSWDGETIYGLLYRPPAGEHPPPVLIAVHGGPTAQARPDHDAAFQYLLSRGIAILDLNFRGSTGYGQRFTRLDNQRLRPNAVQDLAGALDWLAGTGEVDATRAAVMGGSYGGYLTFAAMAQLPGRFRAGVGFVGVSNWLTALEGASPQLKASDRIEYGDIDDPDDRAFFVELSPITHVARVRDPLMVLHGANDPRDPVQEADQLVAALRARADGGVPALPR